MQKYQYINEENKLFTQKKNPKKTKLQVIAIVFSLLLFHTQKTGDKHLSAFVHQALRLHQKSPEHSQT